MGINFGGTLYPWSSGQIIALFVVTGALWIIFVLQQAFAVFTTKEMRMLPIHLYMQKEPLLLFVACTAVGAVSYTSVYYIPIYFQFTRGDTAMDAAARQLPFIFFLITAIPASGLYMSRVGYYKPCYLGGSIVAMVAAVLMGMLWDPHDVYLSFLTNASDDCARRHIALHSVWSGDRPWLGRRRIHASLFRCHPGRRSPVRSGQWTISDAFRYYLSSRGKEIKNILPKTGQC
jgi:hypothetical protein